ncbi:MAG: hypothetical protein JO180_02270 [Gemmatirosa sp.]|nr:hypothetical protein [Gemmatirosa sp.]
MPFVVDQNAYLSPLELSNRDATYLIVRFKSERTERGLVFGKSSASHGLHAEEHFYNWCIDAANKDTLDACFQHGGAIMELFLTKSPCGTDQRDCAATVITLARWLNRKFTMNEMHLVVMGMHKGRYNAASQDAMRRLHEAQPLIEIFAWGEEEADPFDGTDYTLLRNVERGPGQVMQFDNSANPRRGTDVGVRSTQVARYMIEGLGYRHPTNMDDVDMGQ